MSDKPEKAASYKDLIVWQKGIALVRKVYEITRTFPDDEKFGLTAQLRRAAVSIPSNIAEGQARHTTREFIRFVSNAEGSTAEVETQLIIATELNYCEKSINSDVFEAVNEMRRMLNGLRRKLVQKLDPPR